MSVLNNPAFGNERAHFSGDSSGFTGRMFASAADLYDAIDETVNATPPAAIENASYQWEKFLRHPEYLNEFITSIPTFDEMSDGELFKRLNEFVGSGAINTRINDAIAETASDFASEMAMSEEQLAELDNPKTPRGLSVRMKRLAELTADLKEEQDQRNEQARRMEERRAEWESGNMDVMVGGVKVKSGWLRDLARELEESLRNPKKKETLVELYSKETGKSKKDSEKELEEYLEMLRVIEKYNKGEKLTAEEEETLEKSKQPGTKEKLEVVEKVVENANGQKMVADVGIDKDRQEISNMTRQAAPLPNQESVSADTDAKKPLAEKSAAQHNFPSAEEKELNKNFTAAAANTNTPVVDHGVDPVVKKDPAPLVVAKADLKIAATADMAF